MAHTESVELFSSDLDPNQWEAVRFPGHALAITACPGSGKTRVITYRMAWLVHQQHLQPDRVVALTFTNRAALEIKSRVQGLLGADLAVNAGTFHWLCSSLLRRWIGSIGFQRDFDVLSPRDAMRVLTRCVGRSPHILELNPRVVADAISGIKAGVDIDAVSHQYRLDPKHLAALYAEYTAALRSMNALDLDDLPYLAVRILRESTAAREACSRRFHAMLVDEYQDTNFAQRELVRLLTSSRSSVVVVGDEDQAIYGWRHADSRAFADFVRAFPQCSTMTLERSFRHGKYLVRAANSLIEHNSERVPKTIRTDLPAGERPILLAAAGQTEEAEWVVGEIVRIVTRDSRPLRSMAVLYRVNSQSRSIEDALIRAGLAYQVLAGTGFYARSHVRRVVAYLRVVIDERDDEALEMLLAGIVGMGTQRLSTLRQNAGALGVSLYALLRSSSALPGIPHTTRDDIRLLLSRIQGVADCRRGALVDVCNRAVESVRAELAGESDLREDIDADLTELQSIASAEMRARATLRSFVGSLSLNPRAAESEDGIRLSSLHAAKGMEFEIVFMVGVEEGLLPFAASVQSQAGIEEERRLCYVGMTRARKQLYMTYAQTRTSESKPVPGGPSRFLNEIGSTNMTFKSAFSDVALRHAGTGSLTRDHQAAE